MKMPHTALNELLNFHYDRREELYAFVESLPAGELTRPSACVGGSMVGLLLHCLDVEAFWVGQVVRGIPFAPHETADFTDLNTLRRLATQVREETERFVADLTEADMERPVEHMWNSGAAIRSTVRGILLHVVTHETYHRGQALLLAVQAGHDVPDLDFLR